MPPNRQSQTLERLRMVYPDSYSLGHSGENDYEMIPGDVLHMEPGSVDTQVPEIPANQLCAIAFTSGSTGASMPNVKYWETLREGSLSNAKLLMSDVVGRVNLLATVPPQHMWGFETSILLPLFFDAAICHLSPFYAQDIADALQSMPSPRVLISSPVHLDALLKSGVRPANIDRIFTATAPLSKQLAQALEARFEARVLDIFGCTESGILAIRDTSREELWTLAEAFELEVRKDEVVIRAQHLPEDVALPDLIELVGDGRFRWLGRHQDMINIAGKRGSLTDVNNRLKAIPGVTDGVIFMRYGSINRLAAMVVAPGLKPSDILRELKSQIEPVFLPRPLYLLDKLPRQETGKLSTKAVAELFEEIRNSRAARDTR